MRRINTPDGNWQPGDPSTGIKGTIVTRDYMQSQQEELAAVPESVGIKLDPNDNQQLLKGVRKIYADGIASGIQTGGKLNGVNSPNLLFNGSGEFGATGWQLPAGVTAQNDGSSGYGTCFGNPAALASVTGYAIGSQVPVGANVDMTASIDVSTVGITSGSVQVYFNVYAADGSLIQGGAGARDIPIGKAGERYSISVTPPAKTASIAPVIALLNKVNATASGLMFGRCKIERGNSPSLYSQEANFTRVAPLDSPELTGLPTSTTPGPGDNSERIATTAFVQALSGTYATQEWVRKTGLLKSGDTMEGRLAVKAGIAVTSDKYAPLISSDAALNSVGFVNAAGNAWNCRVTDTGDVIARANLSGEGRLSMGKGANGFGEIRLQNAGGGWFYMRGRQTGGIEWINSAYSAAVVSIDDNGVLAAAQLNVGGATVGGDGNIVGGSMPAGNLFSALASKANAGARVQWDSGVNNFGTIDHLNGALPAPWVVCGLSGPGNGTANAITVYGIVLRNQ